MDEEAQSSPTSPYFQFAAQLLPRQTASSQKEEQKNAT